MLLFYISYQLNINEFYWILKEGIKIRLNGWSSFATHSTSATKSITVNFCRIARSLFFLLNGKLKINPEEVEETYAKLTFRWHFPFFLLLKTSWHFYLSQMYLAGRTRWKISFSSFLLLYHSVMRATLHVVQCRLFTTTTERSASFALITRLWKFCYWGTVGLCATRRVQPRETATLSTLYTVTIFFLCPNAQEKTKRISKKKGSAKVLIPIGRCRRSGGNSEADDFTPCGYILGLITTRVVLLRS